MKFTSDVVVGLEIHAELNTKTKLFCGCARSGSEEPNTRTCPICLGHPGSKPMMNKAALEYALRICLALDCKIAPELVFSRKSYFYPDMAKNYQISQYELPLGSEGKLALKNGREIGIERAHIEEDPASLVHPGGMHGASYVLVDYNRSGDPLCEIVTKPEMSSPEEARDFMKRLIEILEYLEVFDVDTCIIKADANVSVKESGYVRAEIKNITGFKEIERALNYEIHRHRQVVMDGGQLILETRSWDAEKGITKSMRVKETEADYGYILDPDLVAIDVTEEMIQDAKAHMPELPQDKIKRFVAEFGIDPVDAEVMANSKEFGALFEEATKTVSPVLAARWLRKELMRVLNYNKMDITEMKAQSTQIISLLELLDKKKITDNVAAKILEKLVVDPFDVEVYVKEQGLEAVSDSGALERFCKEAIDGNPQAVSEFKEGNAKSLNFLVGQVMRASQGKASPADVSAIIRRLLQ